MSRGFAETSKLHGVTLDAVNQYAKWAQLMDDRKEARKAFERIGEDWDGSVWKSRENFDNARRWAYK